MKIDTVLIGNRIRSIRLQRNMTAEVLSERIGLAEVTLRHIETGANKTSLQTILNIADALDISTDYLLGRSSSPIDVDKLSLKKAYKLTNQQEQVLSEMIDKLAPIISNHFDK